MVDMLPPPDHVGPLPDHFIGVEGDYVSSTTTSLHADNDAEKRLD